VSLSTHETTATLRRDAEDAAKLQVGIDVAVARGVLPGPDDGFVPEPYAKIDVAGKTPGAVVDEILAAMGGVSAAAGKVVVICGLSGTGKGTTCAKLMEALAPNVSSWSNGNVFRSVTMLACRWCDENNGGVFNADKVLTKENIASFVGMLEFGKFNGKFDIRIRGLGVDALVSSIQNTDLKSPAVSSAIPTVAGATQGEVVLFAGAACATMGDAGTAVLLEGREETVNYVRSPHRFVLMLSDESLIGKRRAAQRIAAVALASVGEEASQEDVDRAIDGALEGMVAEIQ